MIFERCSSSTLPPLTRSERDELIEKFCEIVKITGIRAPKILIVTITLNKSVPKNLKLESIPKNQLKIDTT